MSRKQELEKIAKEIRSIKAQLEPWYKNPDSYKYEIEKALKDLARKMKAEGPYHGAWSGGSDVKDVIMESGVWGLDLQLHFPNRPERPNLAFHGDDGYSVGPGTDGAKYTGDLSRDFKNIEDFIKPRIVKWKKDQEYHRQQELKRKWGW